MRRYVAVRSRSCTSRDDIPRQYLSVFERAVLKLQLITVFPNRSLSPVVKAWQGFRLDFDGNAQFDPWLVEQHQNLFGHIGELDFRLVGIELYRTEELGPFFLWIRQLSLLRLSSLRS